MKLKRSKKTLNVAVAAAFGAGIAISPTVVANANPFGVSELNSGYMQIAGGHAGEGKCGSHEDKKKEDAEGKCGEGKCGEGKCGGHEDKKMKDA